MLPMQRSLGLEADRGFQNLQGRQQRFHEFLHQQLATPPAVPFPQGVTERMSKLSAAFATYPELADPARRRLVTDARQWLHELRHRLEPSAPMAPPRFDSSGILQNWRGRFHRPSTLNLTVAAR